MELIIGFEIISLVYVTLISIFYFSKGKVDNAENNIYKRLLVITIINIIFEFVCIINGSHETTLGEKVQVGPFAVVSGRLYLFFLYLWVVLFLNYIYVISRETNTKFVRLINNKIVGILLKIAYFAGCILPFVLPMYFYRDERFAYTWGAATDFLVVLFTITIIFGLTTFFLSLRKVKAKKFAPVFLFIFELLIMIIVRMFNPSIQLVTTLLSITTILMYFTIENPDLKLVNELYKNKSIMEQTYEDKSNFLFEITQTLKEPVLNIKNACDDVKDDNKVKTIKDKVEMIRGYSKELDFVLSDILDTNSMTSNVIKFIDNKYNIERLFDEIVSRINPVIPSNVRFTYGISHNIPVLYGDSIKLKQVVTSLLQNSVKHTKNGFIDFQIDTIERFDAIRLIITIRDSSDGMTIDKINEVLTMSGELDVRDIEALEKSHINMKLCQKVIKLMGGNMLIKSYEGKGSEILLVIDQKVAELNKNVVDLYESYSVVNKSIAVIIQNKQLEGIMKGVFKSNNISSSFLLNGVDLIDKIKSGRKYDYIIVANEMTGINGLTILQELNKIPNFKTPVIIIIDETDEKLAHHFLEEGFANYILTSNFDEDLKTIVDKY